MARLPRADEADKTCCIFGDRMTVDGGSVVTKSRLLTGVSLMAANFDWRSANCSASVEWLTVSTEAVIDSRDVFMALKSSAVGLKTVG